MADFLLQDEDPEDDDPSETLFLQRWVERSDGEMELVDLPLTPELFLDPQVEDKFLQGPRHNEVRLDLALLLKAYLQSKRDDACVLADVKHRLGVPGLPAPAPDVSVVYGGLEYDPLDSETWPEEFDVSVEGVRPSLIIEVLAPIDARIRRTDKREKVEICAKAGIQEYLIVDPPRRKNGFRFLWTGYRLDSQGRYCPIRPDFRGALLSETTGLSFGTSPEGDRFFVFENTCRRLLSHKESEAARRVAEEGLAKAEAEIARLREELDRLKSASSNQPR